MFIIHKYTSIEQSNAIKFNSSAYINIIFEKKISENDVIFDNNGRILFTAGGRNNIIY